VRAVADGPMKPKQIAEAVGVDHAVVRQLVRKMADEGDLSTDGQGVYTVHSVHSVHHLQPDSEWSERSEGVSPPQRKIEYGARALCTVCSEHQTFARFNGRPVCPKCLAGGTA
jgi:hypothetical protein